MDAFEEAIWATASKHAPWFVVPADNKWFTRLVVAAASWKRWRASTSRTRRLTAEGEGVGRCAGSPCQAEIKDVYRRNDLLCVIERSGRR